MERYFEKITKCMIGINVQVDDDTYAAIEGLRAVYAIVDGKEKVIVDGACAFQFEGEMFGGEFGVKVCDMNHENRLSLNRYYKYTAPQAFGCSINTITKRNETDISSLQRFADELEMDAKPVVCLCADKVRGAHTLENQVDEIAWSVFKCGNKNGYSIALEGVKTSDDVQWALRNGISMLIIDGSDLWDTAGKDQEALHQEWDKDINHANILDRMGDTCRQIRKNGWPVDLMLDFSSMKEQMNPAELCFLCGELKKDGITITGAEITIDNTENLYEYLELMEHLEYKIGLHIADKTVGSDVESCGDYSYHLSIAS